MTKRTRLLMVLTALFGMGSAGIAKADNLALITNRSSLAGNDTLDWGQLGPAQTIVNNGTAATSAGGLLVTISDAGNLMQTAVQNPSAGWEGNFALGDNVLWTDGANGPLTLVFSHGISGVGMQIQADFYGAFTASMSAYSGATLLNTTPLTETGNSTNSDDNSAIFFGVTDLSGANITSIVIDTPLAFNQDHNFAINGLSLQTSSVPEPPATAVSVLLLAGLAAFRLGKQIKAYGAPTRFWRG